LIETENWLVVVQSISSSVIITMEIQALDIVDLSENHAQMQAQPAFLFGCVTHNVQLVVGQQQIEVCDRHCPKYVPGGGKDSRSRFSSVWNLSKRVRAIDGCCVPLASLNGSKPSIDDFV
jgi:hypothetical protein